MSNSVTTITLRADSLGLEILQTLSDTLARKSIYTFNLIEKNFEEYGMDVRSSPPAVIDSFPFESFFTQTKTCEHLKIYQASAFY